MPLARLQPQAGYGQNMGGLPIVRNQQVRPGQPAAVQAPMQPPPNPFAVGLGHPNVLQQPLPYAFGNLQPEAPQASRAVVPNHMAHGLPAPAPPPAVIAQPPPGAGPTYLRLSHEYRPPRNVQWPTNTPISLIEISTFCPDWFQNPEAIARAIRNEWTREDVAKAQLLAENPLTRQLWRRRSERIQQQISTGGKMIDNAGQGVRFSSEDFRTRRGAQNDLTANAWQFRHAYNATWAPENSGHMRLSELYAAVVNWPRGNDRLQMTRCLEFARANPQLNLDTSHWGWIIQSQGFAAPVSHIVATPQGRKHRDVDARERLYQLPNPQ